MRASEGSFDSARDGEDDEREEDTPGVKELMTSGVVPLPQSATESLSQFESNRQAMFEDSVPHRRKVGSKGVPVLYFSFSSRLSALPPRGVGVEDHV